METVATFFVERVTLSDGETLYPRGFDSERVERLLGIDFILDHFESPPEYQLIDWHEYVPDSFSERLRRAHAALHQISQQQRST